MNGNKLNVQATLVERAGEWAWDKTVNAVEWTWEHTGEPIGNLLKTTEQELDELLEATGEGLSGTVSGGGASGNGANIPDMEGQTQAGMPTPLLIGGALLLGGMLLTQAENKKKGKKK